MQTNFGRRASAAAGFTLIELMVTVAIVSILATIAISSYNSSVRKARRTEARTALLDLASREERFMSTNSVYTTVPAELGYSSAFPQSVGSGYYQVAAPNVVAATNPVGLTPGTAATFVITVTPVSGKGQDKDALCQKFTVDSTGLQAAYDSGGTNQSANCWK
jgi:type IV pilus assembly protein PilE